LKSASEKHFPVSKSRSALNAAAFISAVSLLLRGEMPTEMFLHFFKSLSDASKMNLNIKAEGQNEHHKIKGIFKALARALKMAVRRDIYHYELPSTKGML